MLRILLAVLLAAASPACCSLPEPQAFLVALLALLLAFLLGAAKLAVDLVELIRADLIADGALLVVLGIAFTRITTGRPRAHRALLMALALATQVVPLVASTRSRPRPG